MELINKYFPDITDTQRQQFEALEALYTDWNAKINVISRKDIGTSTSITYSIRLE